jgi:ParB-like chromosome segregation protein Spo0J
MSAIDDSYVRMVPVERIDPATQPFHCVRYFPAKDVDALAASIAHNGGRIDQALGLSVVDGGQFDYAPIYGRRRLLAALQTGLVEVPARIYSVSELEASLMSLRENVLRKGPNLLQRGWAYARLEDQGMSQVDIRQAVGGPGETSVSEGIKYARAIPESVLLEVAAQIADSVDPTHVVLSTENLSKRALSTLRSAAEQGDYEPLRAAIARILDGASKREVTRAILQLEAASRSAGDSTGSYTVKRRDGYCVAYQIDCHPKQLALEDAEQLLQQLTPVIGALEERARERYREDPSPTSPPSPDEDFTDRVRRWVAAFIRFVVGVFHGGPDTGDGTNRAKDETGSRASTP